MHRMKDILGVPKEHEANGRAENYKTGLKEK